MDNLSELANIKLLDYLLLQHRLLLKYYLLGSIIGIIINVGVNLLLNRK